MVAALVSSPHRRATESPSIMRTESLEDAVAEIASRPDLDATYFPAANLFSFKHPYVGDWSIRAHLGSDHDRYLVRPFDLGSSAEFSAKLLERIGPDAIESEIYRKNFISDLRQVATQIEVATFGEPIRRLGISGLMRFNPHIDQFETPGFALIALVSGSGGPLIWSRTECDYAGFDKINRETQAIDRLVEDLRAAAERGSLAEQIAATDEVVELQFERNKIVQNSRKLAVSDTPFQLPDNCAAIFRTGIGGTVHSTPFIPKDATADLTEQMKARAAVFWDWAATPLVPARTHR